MVFHCEARKLAIELPHERRFVFLRRSLRLDVRFEHAASRGVPRELTYCLGIQCADTLTERTCIFCGELEHSHKESAASARRWTRRSTAEQSIELEYARRELRVL